MEKHKIIKEFCVANKLVDLEKEQTNSIERLTKETFALNEQLVYIDEAVRVINFYYNSILESKNIDIVLLEKGKGENVYKEVCYPKLLTDNKPQTNGSTAETIFVNCLFVETIRTLLGLESYPMLIDEAETFDEKHLISLQTTIESQLFITMVEFTDCEVLKVIC